MIKRNKKNRKREEIRGYKDLGIYQSKGSIN